MRKPLLLVSLLIFGMASVATGEVSPKVCLADGNTPFEPVDVNMLITKYPDIMVGTKLTIVVNSNMAEYWFGGELSIKGADILGRGALSGRDYNGFEYPGSCLPAAGDYAAVYEKFDVNTNGFELYGGENPTIGDWFIIDYNAVDIGDCNVAFYDYDVNETEPIRTLAFHHVRTRNFNNDNKVDFADFAILASYWQIIDCNDPNWCEGTDLDVDGDVDTNDLRLFCEFWLARTE